MIEIRKQIYNDHHRAIRDAMAVNSWRSALEILITFLGLAAFIGLGARSISYEWWLFPLSMLFISALQHRLSILQHEAIHSLLFKHKILNDLIGLYLIGLSLGALPSITKHAHLSHHAHLGTSKDLERLPYMTAPQTRKDFFKWSLFKTTGLESIIRFFGLLKSPGLYPGKKVVVLTRSDQIRPQPRHYADWCALLCIQLLLITAFTLTVGWYYYFLLWVIPLLTITRYLMGLRSIVEHAATSGPLTPEARHMNTIHCGDIEAFFLGPLRFNYHAEHHLFPTIPSWRWSSLKSKISNHPNFLSNIRIHDSYVGFLIKSLK